MNIAEWCLRNRATTLVGVGLLILMGFMSYFSLPKAENPEFTIRTALVLTRFPGASPKKIEELVTDKLEEKIREIADVEKVKSQSLAGTSIITVDLYESTPLDVVAKSWASLRNKVDEVTPSLPAGTLPPFVNDEFGDVFGMVLALSSDGFSYREMKDASDYIRNELLKIDGIAKVDLFGVQDERVFIEFSNSLLAERGISPFILASIINSQNIVRPSGDALVDIERVLIESTGEYKSLDDIRHTNFRIPGQADSIALDDVTEVKRDFVDPPSSLVSFNGEQAIVIAVNMAGGGNILEVGERVEEQVKRIQGQLPVGLDLETIMWEPRFVGRKIKDFMGNLGQAFALVFIVMLFTTGLRTGLIASMLIPMAILMCFLIMPMFDITLQQISIASLIIALGIMVDNGVVVSENILVRMARGDDRLSATKGAVSELWKPLLAASMTTIWAFLPIGTAKSNVGEFCLSLFQVISITLLCSWLISLTIVPFLCYFFIKVKVTKETYSGRVYNLYRSLLLYSLRNRALFLAGTFILMAVGVYSFGFVKKTFFPPNEREILLVDIWTPYGSDIRATASKSRNFSDFLQSREEVKHVTTFTGNGGPRWNLSQSIEQSNASYAFMLVETQGEDVDDAIENINKVIALGQDFANSNMPDSRVTLKKLENGPPVGAPIQIRLTGDDIPTLYRLRDHVAEIMASTPGVINISDDWGEWTKKLEVDINQERVKLAGLTSEDVALSLQTQISGLRVSDFRDGNDVIPIVMRSKDAYRRDLGKIESINVYSTNSTRSVPLLQVARPGLTWQPSNIRRENGRRTMILKGYLRPGLFATDTLEKIEPRLNALSVSDEWASGYHYEFGGEQEKSAKSQASIAAGFPLALGLLFLTLVSMFNSVSRPILIGITILPAVFGISLGLLITDAAFGFMAMLGALSLMGIIVNNAIMMIDSMESLRSQGIDSANAVMVSALSRMRPILTTATTTVIGLIPLSLQGGEMWRPMANVIIFGLAFATVLTLALCPVLYSIFFRIKFNDYSWNPEILEKSNS